MIRIIHEKIKTLEIELQELDNKRAVLQNKLNSAHIELKKLTLSTTLPETDQIFSSE